MTKSNLSFTSPDEINFKIDKKTNNQLSIIKKILKTAQDHDKFIFLKGGWNIDLSFGRPTRYHGDIDFHFEKKDTNFWKEWFKKQGLTVEVKDGWYMIFKMDDGHIDFEAVEISDQNIIWKHGKTSQISEVIDQGSWEDIKFKKMKLGVEEYLKRKYVEDGNEVRDKDSHHLTVIKLINK